jgi:hypothetical protein
LVSVRLFGVASIDAGVPDASVCIADREVQEPSIRALTATLYTNPVLIKLMIEFARKRSRAVDSQWVIFSYCVTPIVDWRAYGYRLQYVDRNYQIRKVALGHWRRTVWAALRTTPLPIDVIATHILPQLHAENPYDLQFLGQLDLAQAASVLGIKLPDSDDTASEARSVDKGDSDSRSSSHSNSEESDSESESDDDSDEGSDSGSDDGESPDAKRVKEDVDAE